MSAHAANNPRRLRSLACLPSPRGLARATNHGESPATPLPSWMDPHRSNVDRLIKQAQGDRFAWDRLAELTDTFGNRPVRLGEPHASYRMGCRGHEAGRSRERANGKRDGAALGARERKPRDPRLPRHGADARPQRGDFPQASRPTCSS